MDIVKDIVVERFAVDLLPSKPSIGLVDYDDSSEDESGKFGLLPNRPPGAVARPSPVDL